MCLIVTKLKMKEPSRTCYKVLINKRGKLKSPYFHHLWEPGVNRPKTTKLPEIKPGTLLGKSCIHVYWDRYEADRERFWHAGQAALAGNVAVVVPVKCLRKHFIVRGDAHDAAFTRVRLLKRDYTAALSKKI